MQQVFLILCNRPFLHDFSDRFVQQLSTPPVWLVVYKGQDAGIIFEN